MEHPKNTVHIKFKTLRTKLWTNQTTNTQIFRYSNFELGIVQFQFGCCYCCWVSVYTINLNNTSKTEWVQIVRVKCSNVPLSVLNGIAFTMFIGAAHSVHFTWSTTKHIVYTLFLIWLSLSHACGISAMGKWVWWTLAIYFTPIGNASRQVECCLDLYIHIGVTQR